MALNPDCVLPSEAIAARVAELGAAVRERLAGGPVVVLGVLEAGRRFAADLAAAIGGPVQVEYVRARSYGNETVSSGELELDPFPERALRRARVVVADTVCDTGRTMHGVRAGCLALGPEEVLTCALLDKPSRRECDVALDLVGFSVTDRFFVGYGLDHAGRHRELEYIGVLGEEAHV